MSPQQFISILAFSAPMISALVCGGMVFPWSSRGVGGKDGVGLRRLLTVYFLVDVFAVFGTLIYPYFPKLFVYIQSPYYLSLLLMQVLFYRVVFEVTKFDPQERFSPLHYLMPSLIAGSLFVWSFFVPFDAQVFIAESKGLPAPGYELYWRLYTSKIPVRTLFSVIYLIFSLARLISYKRNVKDFSANESRSSLAWLNVLISLAFCFLPIPFTALIVGQASFYFAITPALMSATVLIRHATLTYNTLMGNYVSLQPYTGNRGMGVESGIQAGIVYGNGAHVGGRKLTKDNMDAFMAANKPYLNPDLKITELAAMVGVSRTTLSSFINTTYNMNFSRDINSLRLKELQQLQKDTQTSKATLADQILWAGFGSYRNYKRFKDSKDA